MNDILLERELNFATNYRLTSNPEDILLAQKEDEQQLFFTDVQVRGHYPKRIMKEWENKGLPLDITKEDLNVLRKERYGRLYWYHLLPK